MIKMTTKKLIRIDLTLFIVILLLEIFFSLGASASSYIIQFAYNQLAKNKGIKTIADVKMPLVITSVDITESAEYIFTNIIPEDKEYKYIKDISIGKAVRASSSLPRNILPMQI